MKFTDITDADKLRSDEASHLTPEEKELAKALVEDVRAMSATNPRDEVSPAQMVTILKGMSLNGLATWEDAYEFTGVRTERPKFAIAQAFLSKARTSAYETMEGRPASAGQVSVLQGYAALAQVRGNKRLANILTNIADCAFDGDLAEFSDNWADASKVAKGIDHAKASLRFFDSSNVWSQAQDEAEGDPNAEAHLSSIAAAVSTSTAPSAGSDITPPGDDEF